MAKTGATVHLIIEGTPNPTEIPTPPPELLPLLGTPRLITAFDLQPSLRGAAPPEVTVEARDDDLIELRLEGDLRLVMSVAEYRAQFGERTSRGPEDKGAVRIRAALPARSRDRGILQWVVKGLQLIGVDLPEMASRRLAEHIDTKKGLEGFYACLLSSETFTLKEQPPFPAGKEPLLVFIHGTMSNTEGSFGGLWTHQKEVRLRLAQQYNDRCYAFEHRTFTQSPITNALALANALPAGATLHLVSHSRGGMVGELLCRASRVNDKGEALPPFDETDFDLFSKAKPASTSNDLHLLAEVLKKKRLRVERFLRVACPARGTTMASCRLDRYLSVLRMGLSPLQGVDWVKDIAWFLAAVVKDRTEPTVMPGLEAMMPDSATVKMLNRLDVMVDSDLRVIAGDYDGDGVLGTVADWAFDGFFGCENDVVVNTPSMYGGAARMARGQTPCGWFFYAQGGQVYHFSYFRQPLTAGQLANGLLQSDARTAGFLPLSDAPHRYDPIARGIALEYLEEELGPPLLQKGPSPAGIKPLLVLVPGIMGSHLRVEERRIWLSLPCIAAGEFIALEEDAAGVVTDGIMRMAYQAAAEFFSATHEVLYFPYDWRLSLQREGKKFSAYMGEVLNSAVANNRPVRILAHSMGGLLVRMAAVLSSPKREGNGWWERFRSGSGNRLVMAGTPNNGSWMVPYVLTGRDPIIGLLKAVDLRHGERDILKIVSGFEGFLEMLPAKVADDCFSAATWQKWLAADCSSWPAPDPASLAKCRENRQLLEDFDFEREKQVLRYVAGCADSTPSGVRVRDGRLVFESSPSGDGRVLWETGIPQGILTWYIEAKHGELLRHEKSFNGLLEIISRGETKLLPAAPPPQRGERAVPGEMVVTPPPYYPDQAMLEHAAVGGEIVPMRQLGGKGPSRCFRVTVCHEDLMAARYPVAVGHYIGDTISGTEAALDRRLGGLLTRRHKLGIYPGPEGTADVFVNQGEGREYCAIVVGLGQVGDLTPAELTSGFAAAVLKLVTSPAAKNAASGESGGIAISSILIGSGAGWGLSVRDSIRALIEGGCRANALLSELSCNVFLAELELLEVFEDRALQALRAVRELAALGVLGTINYNAELRQGVGGRRRTMIEDSSDWWQRIKVQVDDDDVMSYTTLTGLARVEETVQPTQRALVDRLVEQAVTESSVSQDAMVAIYNLLTPNALKERAPDQGDILMMLDEKAARYPWEMMHVGVRDEKIPLALRFGMIRQLSVKEFRSRPARAYQPRALVIANPKLPKNSSFPELPGANGEGLTVTSKLEERGYKVTPQVGTDPLQVVSALFANDYRILHLAGHGVYNYPVTRVVNCVEKTRYVTGMVLDWPEDRQAGRQEPVFLTAVEVEQMAVVPELVFINCCYLGTITGEPFTSYTRENRNLFAASLAASFIRMGVRAVVAAGWAVDDTAAKAFADRFYDALLGGSSFGEAVTAARKAAKDAAPERNTWAAYQCYGDPSYRIEGDRSHPSGKFFLSAREAVCELQSIRSRRLAEEGNQRGVAALQRELQQAENAVPHEWMASHGEIRVALAQIYADMGDSEKAIEQYEAAAKCPDGSCTLKDLDQLADLKCRQAEERVAKGELSAERGRAVIELVIRQLETRSLEFGETSGRSVVTARAYEHLLVVGGQDKKETSRILDRMAYWYGKASVKPDGELDPCLALKGVCMRVLELSQKSKVDSAAVAQLQEDISNASEAATAVYRREASFGNGVHEIDAELYRILLDRISGESDADAASRLEKLYRRYRKVREELGASGGVDLIAKRVRFVVQYLPSNFADLKGELEKVAKRLEG